MEGRWATHEDMKRIISLVKHYQRENQGRACLNGFLEFCEENKYGCSWTEE